MKLEDERTKKDLGYFPPFLLPSDLEHSFLFPAFQWDLSCILAGTEVSSSKIKLQIHYTKKKSLRHLMWRYASLVAQTVKRLSAMQETWVRSLGWEDSLRRKWQPTPVFLPGKSHGWQSPVGYCAWGRKELDMTDQLHFTSLIIPRGFFFPSFCGGKYIGKNVTQINACSTQS